MTSEQKDFKSNLETLAAESTLLKKLHNEMEELDKQQKGLKTQLRKFR